MSTALLPEQQSEICDLSRHPVVSEPFPHIVQQGFIESNQYAELCRTFPTCPPGIGPTGFSLYWGDEGYKTLLNEQPTWQALFNTFHSQHFINWCVDQFRETWERDACKIDLSRAQYVPYCEDRIDKERAKLRRIEHEPHELWVRMDLHQGRVGYDRPVHLDHARRLLSMLIYLYDPRETDMNGGELFLHSGKESGAVPPPRRVTPNHNLMVAFPCSNRSLHSVSAITAQKAPRNYIQVHISSSVDIWPRTAVPGWRLRWENLKRIVSQRV